MSIHLDQYIGIGVIPCLRSLALASGLSPIFSRNAVAITSGTVWHESGAGASLASNPQFIYQRPNGPALGLPQIEPATAHDIYDRYLHAGSNAALLAAVNALMSRQTLERQCLMNMDLGIALTRIKYWSIPSKEPLPGNPNAMAAFYVKWYNAGGKAVVNADLVATFTLACARTDALM